MSLRLILLYPLISGLVAPVSMWAADKQDLACVAVGEVVRLEAKPPERLQPALKTTLRNNCGQDVVAVGLRFEAPGVEPWTTSADWVYALLLPDSPPHGILKSGRTTVIEFPVVGDAPVYSGSISCLLFADRSAIGNSEEIAGIRRGRAQVLRAYRERLDLLRRLLDYQQARAILSGDPSALTSAQRQYLPSLRSVWASSDPHSWSDKVRRQIDEVSRSVEGIKSHLTIESETGR